MRRPLLVCAAFACVMQACAVYAQSKIEVPERVALGEPIVASVKLPEGGKVAWKAGAGSSLIDAGNGRCYVWAKTGSHRIEAVVVAVKDGQLGSLEWLEATYAVGDAPPTPPTPPGPDPPVPPTPTPDDPWGLKDTVTATTAALSAAVKAQARPTASLFRQAADGLESGRYGSIGQAAQWLQTERKALWGANAPQWAPVENAFAGIWNSNWPLTKAQVIQFYRLVAAGLESVEVGQ